MTQLKDKAMKVALSQLSEKGISGHTSPKDWEDIQEHTKRVVREKIEEYANKEIEEHASMGLLDYPVLMAADIILYDAAFVPVGDDQDQHLELTRTLVRKFNNRFGKIFIEPKILYTPTPRVMSLDDPTRKMSKSRPEGCLFLDDTPQEVEKKLKRAVTDSESEVRYDAEKKPAISNLLEIYSGISGETIPQLEKKFKHKGYGEFKMALAKTIGDHFADFRQRKVALLEDPAKLKKILVTGSVAANKIANKKMLEVKRKVGLTL